MRRWRWLTAAALAVISMWIAGATPAHGGGGATILLDAPLANAPVGRPVQIGFMVMQNAQTPIHYLVFSQGDSVPVEPVLTARNQATGESFSVMARRDEAVVGHFVVEVTFPSGGTWRWEIEPRPLPAFPPSSGEIAVGGAPTARAEASRAPAPRPVARGPAPVTGGDGRGVLVARTALVVLTGGLVASVALSRLRRPHPRA